MATNTISGTVVQKETALGIPHLLVVVFDVDPGTRPEEIIDPGSPSGATTLPPVGDRLGSVLTGPDGTFALEYDDGDYRVRNPEEQRPDLMLLVTGPEESTSPPPPPLAVTSVRQNAGRVEQYLIRLAADQLTEAGIPLPTTASDAVEVPDALVGRLVGGGLRETTVIDGVRSVSQGRAERVRRLTQAFHTNLKPLIRDRLSRVSPELADSPQFVGEGESVLAKASALMSSNIEQIVNSTDPAVRAPTRGLVALTQEQATAVSAALDADGSVTAEVLAGILDVGTGAGAATNTFLVRDVPLRRYATPKTAQQIAMEEALGLSTGAEPGASDGSALTASPPGTPITEADILSYAGRLMSTMTTPEEELVVDLEPPASPESVDQSVRNLTFAPSPADVPAIYDFHNLQIAFQHVWQEALDQGVVDLSEDAYHQIVELGGDPGGDAAGTIMADPVLGLLHEGRMVLAAQQVVRDHRNGGDPGGGVTVTVTPSGNVRDQRTGSGAGATCAPDSGDDPLSRVPAVLDELDRRLKEEYAFTVYAANRKERSVNFAVLVDYRQTWESRGSQAGRLVKTTTLAPRETVRYSRKVVKHRKRADREVENHLRSLREETSDTTRSEQDIVNKATSSTNFSMTSQDTVSMPGDVGGSATSTTTFQQAASKSSEDTKRRFHEAVVKAAQEVKDERTTEVNTEESVDTETMESGEITNSNDELGLTCLFFELQRRYRVTEQIHRITPMVLVAQEVPRPDEIDEAWLMTYDWVLRRTLLDDSFVPALDYLCQNVVGDEVALGELRQNVLQQRCVVDALRGQLGVVRERLTAYRQLLESSLLHRATGGDGGHGGLLSGIPLVGEVVDSVESAVGSIASAMGDLLYSGSGSGGQTAQDTLKDSLDRTADEERDLLFRLEREVTALNDVTEKYARAVADHLNRKTAIDRLRTHVKQNILFYMQAIWSHEPPDQRFFRLHTTPVPTLTATAKTYRFGQMKPATNVLAGLAHRRLATVDNPVPTEIYPVEVVTRIDSQLTYQPLVEVADLNALSGCVGNYLIFPLRASNALTDYMMHPYVVAGLNELVDPDDAGNWTLDEFAAYVLHLKQTLSADNFAQLTDQLTAQYQQILTNPRPNGDEIVVPTNSLFIELMPSSHSNIEAYKRISRRMDIKKQQEELRRMALESTRYAARLLAGEHEDPDVDRKIVVEGAAQSIIVPAESA